MLLIFLYLFKVNALSGFARNFSFVWFFVQNNAIEGGRGVQMVTSTANPPKKDQDPVKFDKSIG